MFALQTFSPFSVQTSCWSPAAPRQRWITSFHTSRPQNAKPSIAKPM